MQSLEEQPLQVNTGAAITRDVHPLWTELLKKAVTEPGQLLKAYHLFHNYSLGNCLAVAWQCEQRSIELGPVNSFMGWKKLGRTVRKGERAIWLCMPLTSKAKRNNASDSDDEAQEFIRCFAWKPHWFVLSQTEGADFQLEPVIREWDKSRALAVLDIEEVPFTYPDGNCLGFAKGRSVAVSPLATIPHRTLFHELAHVVLQHTLEGDCTDAEILPRALKEVEAEGVAMLLSETLGLTGTDFSRGYIQHWWSQEPIPERSAQRVFSAANKILAAGRPLPPDHSDASAPVTG